MFQGSPGRVCSRPGSNRGFFERAYVDEASGTVAWPGGLDLAPDRLHSDLAGVETERG